eukprot:TRINITY_DN76060_c0_g1_i1.p1 TRINITY_DN76060_c0_g1~~TRINITY_DN76060_c0_g1_i1.p1  ORF type:complete len:433 (-),score=52.49 TRINITY_DN76060_c0_g1_i1:92-1240(-)
MALWYTSKGYMAWQVGLVFAFMGVADPVIMPLLAALLDKFRAHNLGICLLFVVAGLLRLLMLLAHPYAGFWLVATLDVMADPALLLGFAVFEGVTVFSLVNKGEFPALKICTNLGQALIASTLGWLITLRGTFDFIFYVHFSICCCASTYWWFAHRGTPSLKGDFTDENLNFLAVVQHCSQRFDSYSLVVLLGITLIGLAFGTYSTFRLVILKDLGASATLLGLADTIVSLSEIPMLMISTWMIRHLGTASALVFSLVITGLRFYIIGIISNPLHGLYAEALSGFTFALPYTAGVLYFSARIPEDLKASLLSFLAVVIFGIGFGGGALLGGLVADLVSLQVMFKYSGAATFTCASLFALLGVCISGDTTDVVVEQKTTLSSA